MPKRARKPPRSRRPRCADRTRQDPITPEVALGRELGRFIGRHLAEQALTDPASLPRKHSKTSRHTSRI